MTTATKTRKHSRTTSSHRMTAAERQAAQTAALARAQDGRTCENDMIVIHEFAARGIDAHPREDVFTFNAWRALHRHVRKGEHGVHILSYATRPDTDHPDDRTKDHTYPVSAVVFHVSQTDPDDEPTTPSSPSAPAPTTDQDDQEDDRDPVEDRQEAKILQQEQRDEAAADPGALF